jgi:hypothetical protein
MQMMKALLPLMLLAVPGLASSLLEEQQPLTLDQTEFSRIWQEVKTGVTAPQPARHSLWQQAVLAEDTELGRVLLLAWLQQQNPQCELVACAGDYAAAVSLHLSALAGQPAACVALAAAYRAGQLGVLCLPQSEEKARWFEQRALIAEKLPE